MAKSISSEERKRNLHSDRCETGMSDDLPIKPHTQILVLNNSYEPINVTNWKRAIVLLLKEKAQALSKRVIRLVNYIRIPFAKIVAKTPSRAMIYKRDNNKCQYCGATRSLTIDHVIPRSKGGQDTWDNLVVACASCNVKKGDKLLEQTNMKLARKPFTPYNKVQFSLSGTKVPEWQEFLFV